MTVARYDDVADFYSSGWLDVYDDAVSLALFDLLGPVNDLSVLDLACGHGRISRSPVVDGVVLDDFCRRLRWGNVRHIQA